jgi:probable HAF family extracellular repeat protein
MGYLPNESAVENERSPTQAFRVTASCTFHRALPSLTKEEISMSTNHHPAKRVFAQLVALIALCSSSITFAAGPYVLTLIPPLPVTANAPRSQGNAINASGQVVGLAAIDGNSNAFIFQSGTITSLGNLGLGGGYTTASAINDSGTVVGLGSTSTQDLGYVYSGGTFTVVAPLPNGDRSAVNAINNAGRIVGTSTYGSASSPTGDRQAFVADGPGYVAQALGFLPGGNRSFANAINDQGLIGGSSRVADSGNVFAAAWSGGVISALPNLANATGSNVLGINNAGDMVGVSTVGGNSVATLWSASGDVLSLGTLPGGSFSQARDINNLGQIVGTSTDAGGANRAFLYEHGQMLDLNTLVTDLGPFASLQFAQSINDNGQITGYGNLSAGGIRGFVLTPVPEPASFSLLALGLLALVLRRKRPTLF